MQALPEEILLPERAHDIQGQVFGALTALRPVGNTQRGVLWLCECECGRHAIRTTAALRMAVKNHQESQCIECQRELFRGRVKYKTEWFKEFYLLYWHDRGTLYTEGQLKAIKRDIKEGLRAIDFPVGEPTPELLDGHGYDQPEPYGALSDGQEHTLAEIGLVFDVNRERIRQICVGAMGKLLRKHRRLLYSLLTGEFDWRSADVEKVLATLREEKIAREEAETEFLGCRCKAYDMVLFGRIYCRACGKVWQVGEQQAMRILTATLIRRSTIVDD